MPNRALAVWRDRPPEVAYLLNAAFCALVLKASVQGYRAERAAGLPLPLAFLVLPIVLHKPTRSALPSTARTRLHSWLSSQPDMRVGFADRVTNLVPYTREAILFGVQHQAFQLSTDATLDRTRHRLRAYRPPDGSEPRVCLEQAELMGRRFARAGDVPTVFAMWGVRP
jgi:hypothetical protein